MDAPDPRSAAAMSSPAATKFLRRPAMPPRNGSVGLGALANSERPTAGVLRALARSPTRLVRGHEGQDVIGGQVGRGAYVWC